MPTTAPVPVVFDVLGTCFSLDNIVDALQQQFTDAPPALLRSITEDWFHSAQRDFAYLSTSDSYTPFATILKASLPRFLLSASLISLSSPLPSLTHLTSLLSSLTPRPSLSSASSILLSSTAPTFRLLAATNGAQENTRKLLDSAGLDEEKWQIWSCDEVEKAKPEPEVYEAVWLKLGLKKESKRHGWFVASHMWDLHAAKKAGFKTAWVSYEEHLPLTDIWGEADITARDLEDAAKQIIAREKVNEEAQFM